MKKQEPEAFRETLYQALAKQQTPEEIEAFLADLCTENEVDYMAQRLESAKMLLEGATYQQVMDAVGISTATLSRVNRCVKYGEGYRQVLGKPEEDNHTEEKEDRDYL